MSDWRNVTTRPLWHCAQLPGWIESGLYESDDTSQKKRLAGVFRQTAEALSPLFMKGVDMDQARQALEDVCRYDASKDGDFVLPTLESRM